MSTIPICPCDAFEHPQTPQNQPGLPQARYRVGDFRTFREALLRPLPGEARLGDWRPAAQGDLALQVLEWWAYIADVLTVYTERSLNGALLGTAVLPEEVRRLVQLLGYRPRPGIAASARVGALLSGPRPLTLPAGFRLDSKPAPGKQPQAFETTQSYSLSQPDAIAAEPPGVLGGPAGQLYLEGTVKSIEPGDFLLLAAVGSSIETAVVVAVQSTAQAKDQAGNPYTQIRPVGKLELPNGDAAGYQLLQSKRTVGLWKYSTTVDLIGSQLELEGVERGIGAGDGLLLTAPGTSLTPVLLLAARTEESIWYTNGNGPTPPTTGIPAGAPHTSVSWTASDVNTAGWNKAAPRVRVRIDWRPAGTLRNAPVATYNGTPSLLVARAGQTFPVGDSQTVLIEDANGDGVQATGSVVASALNRFDITGFAVTPPLALKTPLRVLPNVLALTRGKTVERETLGVGDATVLGQEFVLKNSPLTYLPAGDSYESTLRVYVNGVEWTEVPSFYGQPASAQVFVTYEDDQQRTHVQFGDNISGAAIPTGAPVVVDYRMGSSADAPASGSLTIISKPFPGLRTVRQPEDAGGGTDPEPRDQMRRLAPRSVLTFGRAISADDYETLAAQAPGVTRVRAVYGWNAQEQRATITLYVGDTPAAVDSARNALLVSADPNRPVSVLAATRVSFLLHLAIRVEPGRIAEDVVSGVRTGLAGLFGPGVAPIGHSFYFSQVSEACLGVPGVRAVSFVSFTFDRPDPVTGLLSGRPPRINASVGEFFEIQPESIFIFPEVLTSV